MSIVAAYVVPHPPLIVPAVGHGQERAIQATVDAYEEVARRMRRSTTTASTSPPATPPTGTWGASTRGRPP